MGLREKILPKETAAWVTVVPVLVFLLIVAAELIIILVWNNGRFVFSLDDPYIHMALARRIMGGTYGINVGEFAAPSSSVLWPFLLVPFMALPFADEAPLLINILLAVATLLVYARIVITAVQPGENQSQQIFSALLILMLIPGTNLFGLAFTGMEHSLQLFLTSLLIWGLILESRTGRAPWWFLVVIVAGPLIRYENLGLTLPTLLYLVIRGHWKRAVLAAVVLALLLGGFSLFLDQYGRSPLPNPILAKSMLGSLVNAAKVLPGRVYYVLSDIQGALLALAFGLLLFVFLSSRRTTAERLLAGVVAVGIGFHLVAGGFDGYHRYELYIWTAAGLMLLYLYRHGLRWLSSSEPIYKSAFILLFFGVIINREYASVLVTNALASSNIYEQQYQMHRFATEFYAAPVAVVDLGWVAYKNDNYVLDLYGLGSTQAAEAFNSTQDPEWMNELAAEHSVKVAMIYDFRFSELPQNWQRIGVLHLGHRKWSVASDEVSFYALDDETATEIWPLLSDFQMSLPPGVRFETD
jgi:uncharacterized protein YhhL (DUF1145 family)